MTFMALLAASFLLLLVIVNSVAGNDALRAKRQEMAGVASGCARHLAETYQLSGMESFRDYVLENTEDDGEADAPVVRLLDAIMTNFEDMTVYVTDASGGFIFCTGKAADAAPEFGKPLISPDNLSDTVQGDDAAGISAVSIWRPFPPRPRQRMLSQEPSLTASFCSEDAGKLTYCPSTREQEPVSATSL